MTISLKIGIPRLDLMKGGVVPPPPASDINVLDSAGTVFGVTFDVLNSSGTSYTVTGTVLSSDGTSYSV